MDFAMLPPEVNSGRMYAGPGSRPILAAANAWDGLAAELQSTAASYESAISELSGGPWLGPSSASMAAAAAPYLDWMTTAAAQADQTATQAKAAAAAYEAAFAMTVPPPVIAANRTLLMTLIATNIFGQNTAAIAVVRYLSFLVAAVASTAVRFCVLPVAISEWSLKYLGACFETHSQAARSSPKGHRSLTFSDRRAAV
jgi:hypothetical protein